MTFSFLKNGNLWKMTREIYLRTYVGISFRKALNDTFLFKMFEKRPSSLPAKNHLKAQAPGPCQGDYCNSDNDDEIQHVGSCVRRFLPPDAEAGPVRGLRHRTRGAVPEVREGIR